MAASCTIDGCERPRHSRTWCGTHYARWRNTGTTDNPTRQTKTCTLDRCTEKHYSLGLCATHYSRMRHKGTTEEPWMNWEDRFWRNVEKTDDCWTWKGKPGKNGYGRFTRLGTTHLAHRFAYEHIRNTSIPDEMTIDHLCRNRMCVNPDHMELTTRAENGRRGSVARWSTTHAERIL